MVDECNVDDILCQIRVLGHLKGLQDEMGKEGFSTEFPELTGLGEHLETKIEFQRGKLRDSLVACGQVKEDELPLESEEKPSEEVGDDEEEEGE